MLSRFLDWSHHLARRLPAVIPSSCALCGLSCSTALCEDCNAHFFSHAAHRCMQYGLPMNNGTTSDTSVPRQCGECLHNPRAFDATVVAADYAAPVDHLVLALKFGNRLALAPLFAGLLQKAMQRAQPSPMSDLLTVVPLGEQRLIERGFNQALEIARPLSRAMTCRSRRNCWCAHAIR